MNIQQEIKKAQQEQIEGLNPFSMNVIVDRITTGIVVIPREVYDTFKATNILDLIGPFMGNMDEFNAAIQEEEE